MLAQAAEAAEKVRLEVKENRRLSSTEVTELVDTYNAGASQKQLAARFGVHEQTVPHHLIRQGVTVRPIKVLSESQKDEVVRQYVEEYKTLAEVASRYGVSARTIRDALIQ